MNVSVARTRGRVRPAPARHHRRCAGAEWDAVRRTRRRDATGYHLWRWRQVFERAFGHETVYLAARETATHRRRAAARRLQQPPVRPVRGLAAVRELRRRAAPRTTRSARGAGREARRRSRARTRAVARRAAAHRAADARSCRRAAQGRDAAAARRPTPTRCGTALDRKVRNQVRKAEKSGLTCAQRRRRAARRVLRGVRAQHARPGHAGLFAAASSRGARDVPRDRARVFLVDHGDRRSPARSRCRTATCSKCRGPRRCASTAASARTTSSTGRSSSTRSTRGSTVARLRPLDAERRHVPVQEAVGREARAAVLGVRDAERPRAPEPEPLESEIPRRDRRVDAAAGRGSPRSSARTSSGRSR